MSISTIEIIKERIRSAALSSPIAVFHVPFSQPLMDGKVKLNAVFADTVRSRNLIAAKDPLLVGIYHHEMTEEVIMKELSTAATPALCLK